MNDSSLEICKFHFLKISSVFNGLWVLCENLVIQFTYVIEGTHLKLITISSDALLAIDPLKNVRNLKANYLTKTKLHDKI
jgi:hypothetical protein